MGTLKHQEPRKSKSVTNKDILNFIKEIQTISEETELSIDQVIKIVEIKELERRNNLYVTNGDIHDEQMSGFGDLLDYINSSIEKLAEAVTFLDPKNDPNA